MWPEAPPEPAPEPEKKPMLKCISKHPEHNRFFIAILENGEFLECEVKYRGASSASRGTVLDNQIMPILFEKLR